MILRYFYDDYLAQASYMLGCAKTGEALIIDPNRDIDQYVEEAQKEGLSITQVIETHIHADFVSGGRELAAKCGASFYVSGMRDGVAAYDFTDDDNVITVQDNDTWFVGNIRLKILYTPGHTPEHISIMITDTAASDHPLGIFTGDFLFAGDIGRPDLLETAVGQQGTKEQGARQQWQNVQQFKEFPDYLQVWPGHGAGSACGKALGAVPSTTVGYEKRVNPAFQHQDEAEFIAWVLADQPSPPRYFAQMKNVNKVGPAMQTSLTQPQSSSSDLQNKPGQTIQLMDFRPMTDFTTAHIPNAINIPAQNRSFLTYVGWFVDYERPLHFIASDDQQAQEIINRLRTIGVDNVGGYLVEDQTNSFNYTSLPQITLDDLKQCLPQNTLTVLDVRNEQEFTQTHIKNA
ncbi:MAG: MBL fold metallo-hydrolase, partial [Chloroflexota bacterium]